jgi:hypothetical protein
MKTMPDQEWKDLPPGSLKSAKKNFVWSKTRNRVLIPSAVAFLVGAFAWATLRWTPDNIPEKGGIACAEVEGLVMRQRDGTLPEMQLRKLQRHLRDCPICKAKWELAQKVKHSFGANSAGVARIPQPHTFGTDPIGFSFCLLNTFRYLAISS